MKFYKIIPIGKNIAVLTYKSPKNLKIGDVLDIEIKSSPLKGVVKEETAEPTFDSNEAKETEYYIDTARFEVAKFISAYYVCNLSIVLNLFYHNKKCQTLPKMVDKKIVNTLSPSQKEALSFIEKNPVSLLFGDTGSGKSEIYFELISRALREAKTVIMLMPEIALTPQMEKRLKENFGDSVALWHSKVTPAKKRSILDGIYEDRIKIVAGARSALFLPLLNLGLIIVDEEHESSYKAQNNPKINARDLSVYYGLKVGAKVVLGSATPSLKSYEKYPVFRLKGRYFESKKRVFFDSSEGFSGYILDSIKAKLDKKEQVLVFNPTRGDFKYLYCTSCNTSVHCPYCAVSMSLHKNINALRCHYCGFTSKIPQECPNCSASEFITLRAGTSNIKEELEEVFPEARIEKFDRDSIKSEKKLRSILDEFNNNQIDILIGTQMLSKGHDYHNVSLAVIFGLDFLLNSEEYNAREKTMALAIQVAGRSGRKFGGEVILQSRNREFFDEFLGDYEKFLKTERAFRKGLYPPFVKLAVIRFEDRDERRAKASMEEALSTLETIKEIEVVGAREAPIKKIAGKHRYVILLRSSTASHLSQALRQIANLKCDIDVDPESFV